MNTGTGKIVKGKVFTFDLDNDLNELDRLQGQIEDFGHVHGLEKKTIFETNLVLEEILTNIVFYGHGNDNPHKVRFSLHCSKDNINIQIEDDGIPFNLLEAKTIDLDADIEHRAVGGLGIHLVRKLMDEVTYKRVGGKNVVTLRKDYS